MAKGFKTGGRQKGTPNQITRAFRESVQIAYDAIGGDDALAVWARDNPSEFYRIAARLIPVQLTGQNEGITVIVDRSCSGAVSLDPPNSPALPTRSGKPS